MSIKEFECNCNESSVKNSHVIEIATYNAAWHREKFHQTRDRYHLGQWKAYFRVAKRLKTTIK
jgi:hypothetical protein